VLLGKLSSTKRRFGTQKNNAGDATAANITDTFAESAKQEGLEGIQRAVDQKAAVRPRLLQQSKWIVLLSRVCGTAQHGRSEVLESILSVEVVYEFPSLGLDEQLAALQEVLPAFLDRRLRHIRRVFGVTLPLLKKSPSPHHHSGSNSDNNHCQHRHVEI